MSTSVVDGIVALNPTQPQNWSIRTIRTQNGLGGTVTVGSYFNTWAKYGMNSGNHYYQIVATEGNQSSGPLEITMD